MKEIAIRCSLALLALGQLFAVGQDGTHSLPPKQAITKAAATELKGQLEPTQSSAGHLQFKTDSGSIYTLLSNRASAALYADTNLQTKMLILKGRVLPEGRRFEVTGNLHSIHEGKTNELYYYCDICSIKGSEGGPCMCCREPMYLMEKPKGSGDH